MIAPELLERIGAALREKSPLTPRELQAKTKVARHVLRRAVNTLAAQGSLVVTGATMNRQIALKGKPSAPASSGNGHAAAPSPTPAAAVMVEARNLALKMRVKQGPATFAQLLEAMPEERDLDANQSREACMRTIRRLMIKNEIREVGDTYRAV